MKCPGRNHSSLRQIAVLGGMLAMSWSLLAAEETVSSPPASSDIVNQGSSPPPMPMSKSPVDVFRELLGQSPGERAEFLAKRPPESRKLILAKLREYESLTAEERTLRLEVTELRWYLLPLMKVSEVNRAVQLATVPDGVRKLVEDRLERWDKLPREVQKQVLDNEDILRFYFECVARNGDQAAGPPEPQSRVLSDEQRQAIKYSLEQFFLLTPEEKSKVLHTLSEPERQQIDKSLQTFANLTPAQRSECLRSFQKFASLSIHARQQFLKSAEEWETMTPTERQSWKDLVYKLSRLPPIPPGLGFPPIPGPLQPSTGALPSNSRPIATNDHN